MTPCWVAGRRSTQSMSQRNRITIIPSPPTRTSLLWLLRRGLRLGGDRGCLTNEMCRADQRCRGSNRTLQADALSSGNGPSVSKGGRAARALA
eukprot:382679-Alexandrium_andersonii.AAC.1